MKFLDDMLSDEEFEFIKNVINYPDHHFDHLISIARLDPAKDLRYSNLRMVDFRNSDLRGFDFTGADLRFSTKDHTTVIDDTTCFDEAQIDWIEEEELPVVEIMLEAQAASSREVRRRSLDRLVNTSSSAAHTNKFLLQSIENAGNLDALLDFADYWVGEAYPVEMNKICRKLASILEQTKKRISRKKSAKSGGSLAENLIGKLSHSDSNPMKSIYKVISDYDFKAEEKQAINFKKTTMLGLEDIISAIRASLDDQGFLF